MKRQVVVWLVLLGLLFSVSIALALYTHPAATNDAEAREARQMPERDPDAATWVDQGPGLVTKNPAAVYCTELGYTYEIVEQADGSQDGVCHLPDGATCSAWAFLRGQCGTEHSICARRGLKTVVRSDGGNPFSREYAVCTDEKGRSVQSASEMADLQAKSSGETQRLPFGLRSYGPEPVVPGLPTPDGTALAAPDLTPAALPGAFDWRDHDGENWITPVKDQGVCGSCWAFGSVGTVEAQYNIDSHNPDLDLNLAEQYLVTDCAGEAGNCAGGWYTEALYFIQSQGIPDEDCLPYGDGGPGGCSGFPGCDEICTYRTSGMCSDYQCSDRCATWSDRRLRIQGFGSVGSDKTAIKQALVEHGPLAVEVSTYGSFGTDGIYRCSDNVSYNHIVVLVGYSDSSGGYWILKNSHGTGYADGGYYKVAYDTCAVQRWPVAVQTYVDQPGVTLSPPGDTEQGENGEVVTYRPWLINHTGESQSFEIGLSANSWPTSLSVQHTRTLADGESLRFSVRVTVPEDALDGASDAVTVTAVGSSSEDEDSSTFVTQADVPPRIEVSPSALSSVQAPDVITTQDLAVHNPSTSQGLFTVHQALPTGAALLLSLNETGAATLFLDGSGNGNHATCSGDSCPRAGVWSPRGKAAEFDGEQSALTTPVYLDQSSSSPGATMIAWAYPTDPSTDPQYVISGDGGSHDWGILSYLGYWYVTDGQYARRTSFQVDMNRWQHLAAVWDPVHGQTRFYYNGQEWITPYLVLDPSSHDIMVGENPVWRNHHFEGKIDEVQVYRRPLSASEVQAIYQGSSEMPWLSWDVPYWRLSGGDTRIVQFTLDASGLQPDTYTALVNVVSDDPDHSRINVPVTMVVTDEAPDVAVSPVSLAGQVLQGESLTRTLTISNGGTAALTYQLTRQAGADWIQMSPTNGTVPAGGAHQIEVTLDAAASEPGEQSAWIRVTSNDPDQPLVEVTVTMTVLASAPEISVQPASFSESLAEGATIHRTLTISNGGTADLAFELSEVADATALDVSWLVLDPVQGIVSAGGEQAIQVTLDATGLAVGEHHARIRIQSNDPLTPTLDIPVTLTVRKQDIFSLYLPIVLR